jgi:uncharacterized protein YabN with tetrapyrrole methylase and pyrophosphatase domain
LGLGLVAGEPQPRTSSGSLTVVGTGIQFAGHLTVEARLALERADVVLSILADPAARRQLERLNPRARSLKGFYEIGRPRSEAYAAMTEEILRHVRQGLAVCVAVYGHPGLFVRPTHAALAQAREEGFRTRLLPGISAEDCLFADLGVDPAGSGWQSYEATVFLEAGRAPNPDAALVLWQLGTVGNELTTRGGAPVLLPELVAMLLDVYPASHEVVVYEASVEAGFDPRIVRVPLGELTAEDVSPLATLYVPPLTPDRG